MFARMLTFLTVITLVGAPAPARSDEKTKDAAPSFVIRVDSIDNMMENAKYLADLAGQKDKVDEGLGFVKAAVESQKIDKAIDFSRPMGMYGKVNASDITQSNAVILIPILEEKPLLDLMGSVGANADKGEDGIYSVQSPFIPQEYPIFLCFANKYAYVTVKNKGSVAKENILDPAKVFSSVKATTFSADFRLDQVPDDVKQMVIGLWEGALAQEKQKEIAGETKTQAEIRRKLMDGMSKHFSHLIKEAAELGFSFNIDRKEGKLTGDMTFTGKPGTELAKEIAQAGKSQSLFGGLVSSKAAMNFLLHPILPEDVRNAIGPAVDEGFKEAMEKEKDSAKRDIAEKIFKAIEPSLKSGELDLAFSFRGPSKENHYTFLGAAKLKEGEKVEQALKDLAKKAPEKDQAKMHFDADTSGDVKIHKFDVQGDFDEKAKAILGKHPVYLAFRSDAALVSGGARGLETIKEALKSEPKSVPTGMLEISMSHLAPLILAHAKGHSTGDNDGEEMKKIVQETFKGDNDKIRVTLEGGKELKGTFDMSAAVIKFAALVGVHEQHAFKDGDKEIKPPKKKPKKEQEKEKDKEEDK